MKILLITILALSLLFNSGCVLGIAALIRWDHMKYKRQQEELKKKENKDEQKSSATEQR